MPPSAQRSQGRETLGTGRVKKKKMEREIVKESE